MPNGNLMDDLELEEEIKRADPATLAATTARTLHYMAKQVKKAGENLDSLRDEMRTSFDNLPCRDKGTTNVLNCNEKEGKYGVKQLMASAGLSGPVWIVLYLLLKAILSQKFGIGI